MTTPALPATPLHVDPRDQVIVRDANNEFFCDTLGGSDVGCKLDYARATYIVTACNAYPALVEQNAKLKEALRHAIQDCACTVKERASGHLMDCRAPEWSALLAEIDHA